MYDSQVMELLRYDPVYNVHYLGCLMCRQTFTADRTDVMVSRTMVVCPYCRSRSDSLARLQTLCFTTFYASNEVTV